MRKLLALSLVALLAACGDPAPTGPGNGGGVGDDTNSPDPVLCDQGDLKPGEVCQ